ncbi:biotin--[acetyl-CoA-carboxylase] ligase [Breznakia pachnodae]|uniref:Bifunctional ligase/repressor BirA n=1 Tax=Breznakia pachnodae TaxID=265178 RepID=A0ABU0DZ26_9FIRM|nr:biotin--[acetyl-CoA-carboxylase] ligase [Breznakia pachnodae]MDQ0359738.1 BirA family biotin operon repressor/biotin-[acetyl-CoA-carboxylase] ligase [Breznakia pachnodae]
MKSKILQILNEHCDTYISGEEISSMLKVSRMTISKQIRKLIEQGYQIESSTKKGYRFSSNNDVLIKEQITDNLQPFFYDIEIMESVSSTNDYLKTLAFDKQEGYVCVADYQEKGKGRNGRSFYSPKQKGIYMSFLLKPTLSVYESLKITACVSVALWEAIKKNYQIDSKIKWVNDIFIEEKKIGGILCEASLEMNTASMDYMVVGIGVNVHKQIFAKDLASVAGSIEEFSDKIISRNQIIKDILNGFYKYYNEIDKNTFLPAYKEHSSVLHKDIMVYERNNSYPAKVLDIDTNASLIIEKEDGSTSTINSGEVSIRKI